MLPSKEKKTDKPSRFITCIGLRGILKIRVWTTSTIQANTSCVRNMWTTMRLAHYRLRWRIITVYTTTATPDAVRTGFTFRYGVSTLRWDSGIAEMISTIYYLTRSKANTLGVAESPYLRAIWETKWVILISSFASYFYFTVNNELYTSTRFFTISAIAITRLSASGSTKWRYWYYNRLFLSTDLSALFFAIVEQKSGIWKQTPVQSPPSFR